MLTPARPTRAKLFGPEYEQLLLAVWSKTPFRFPLETEAKAKAMRLRVYAYFRFLREENIRLDLVEMSDLIQLQLEGNVIVFLRNDQTWDHENLRKLLGITQDDLGLAAADGSELKSPDLLGTRLSKQLEELRQRNAAAAPVRPPMKT